MSQLLKMVSRAHLIPFLRSWSVGSIDMHTFYTYRCVREDGFEFFIMLHSMYPTSFSIPWIVGKRQTRFYNSDKGFLHVIAYDLSLLGVP